MLLQKLDDWSNNEIKNSLVGKVLTNIVNKTNFQASGKIKKVLYLIFLLLIYLLLISLIFPQFAEDRFGIGLIILATLIVFLLNVLTKNFTSINFSFTDFLIILFITISIISTFTSYFFKESLIGLLKYIILFLSFFQMKFLLSNSLKNNLINPINILIISSFFVSLIGIYQYAIHVEPLATWEDPSFEKSHTRVYSTLSNPNLLAGYLLTILPLSIIFIFYKKINSILRVISLGSALSIFLCLIFTGSRGGYLGFFAQITLATIIFISYLIKKKKLPVFLLILASLAFFVIFYLTLTFLFPQVLERLITIFLLRDYSTNSFRLNVWMTCLNMLKDNFLIGVGPGNATFRLSYGLYMRSGFDALSSYNILLEIAIELGVIGSLIFLLLFLTSFLRLHYLFWKAHDLIAFGIFLSLLGILVQGMVDTVLFRAQVMIPFFLLIATIDKLELDSREKEIGKGV